MPVFPRRQRRGAGLCVDAVKQQLCTGLFGGLGQIVPVTDGHAARGDDQRVLRQQPGQLSGQRGGVIRACRQQGGLGTEAEHPGRQHGAVGIVDLAGAERGFRTAELVSRGHKGRAGLGVNGHCLHALPGQQAEGDFVQPGARRDQAFPRGDVLPRKADVGPGFHRSMERHGLAIVLGILLPQHAVRSGRDRGPRHDAGSRARGQRPAGVAAGTEIPADGQGNGRFRAGGGNVRRPQGIAVQRRAVKRGLCHPGTDIPRRHPAQRLQQRDLLGFLWHIQRVQNPRHGLFHRGLAPLFLRHVDGSSHNKSESC